MDTEHEVIPADPVAGLTVLARTLYDFTALISREYTLADEHRIEAANDDV